MSNTTSKECTLCNLLIPDTEKAFAHSSFFTTCEDCAWLLHEELTHWRNEQLRKAQEQLRAEQSQHAEEKNLLCHKAAKYLTEKSDRRKSL